MANWISNFFRKRTRTQPLFSALDLLVVEGVDAGQRFTVDADHVVIRRGEPTRLSADESSNEIILRDPSVSARQALLQRNSDGYTLEHAPDATHATCVNQKPIERSSLQIGDRIQFGRVSIDVKAHTGPSLINLTPLANPALSQSLKRDREETTHGGDTTEITNSGRAIFSLATTIDGRELHFALKPGINTIGRDPASSICTPAADRAISRHHADLDWTSDGFELIHRSPTNATFLNGFPVTDRAIVSIGDRINLADHLMFQIVGASLASDAGATDTPGREKSLRRQLQDVSAIEERIQRDFATSGTFVDVDIAGSTAMKQKASNVKDVILSFERWREWVGEIIDECSGCVLNSNGDELMCFFEGEGHADCALDAGKAILSRLAEFNQRENRLPVPFRLRLGIHSGDSLVDRREGRAYSASLDIAGHLQKHANVDSLLISQATLDALANRAEIESVGIVGASEVAAYRVVGTAKDGAVS